MNSRQVLSLYETLSLPQADPSIDFNNPANKITTPVDEHGLIRIPELLIAVRATLDPEYKIENTGNEDDHHFYFYGFWYPYLSNGTNPHAFRNLPMHKGHMPRLFHEWIEKVTIPAAPPGLEVMQSVINSFNIQKNIFISERERIRWERQYKRDQENLAKCDPEIHKLTDNGESRTTEVRRRAVRYARGSRRHRERLADIPQEFQAVNINVPPSEIAAQVGHLVMKPSIRTRRLLIAA